MFSLVRSIAQHFTGAEATPLTLGSPASREDLYGSKFKPAYIELDVKQFDGREYQLRSGDFIITDRNDVRVLLDSTKDVFTFACFEYRPTDAEGSFHYPSILPLSRYRPEFLTGDTRLFREIVHNEENQHRKDFERASYGVRQHLAELFGAECQRALSLMAKFPGKDMRLSVETEGDELRHFYRAAEEELHSYEQVGQDRRKPGNSHSVELWFNADTDGAPDLGADYSELHELERYHLAATSRKFLSADGEKLQVTSIWFGSECGLSEQARADLRAAVLVLNSLLAVEPILQQRAGR